LPRCKTAGEKILKGFKMAEITRHQTAALMGISKSTLDWRITKKEGYPFPEVVRKKGSHCFYAEDEVLKFIELNKDTHLFKRGAKPSHVGWQKKQANYFIYTGKQLLILMFLNPKLMLVRPD
jgi:predicted DNA-binding transcriptional regulator AlpA